MNAPKRSCRVTAMTIAVVLLAAGAARGATPPQSAGADFRDMAMSNSMNLRVVQFKYRAHLNLPGGGNGERGLFRDG